MWGDEGEERVVVDESGVDVPEVFVSAIVVEALSKDKFVGLVSSLIFFAIKSDRAIRAQNRVFRSSRDIDTKRNILHNIVTNKKITINYQLCTNSVKKAISLDCK